MELKVIRRMLHIRRIFLNMFKLVLFTFCTTLAMPPQPDFANQAEESKTASTSYLLHQKNYQERGTNSSNYHLINSLSRKGTAPFGDFNPPVITVDFSVRGDYELVRDGKDIKGKQLPGGIYFCRLKTENSQGIKNVILPKYRRRV